MAGKPHQRKYRKISTHVWNDRNFCALSDSAKLVFFFLLTHPTTTAFGAIRGTESGFAAELGWGEKGFREGFREASAKGMAKRDEVAPLFWFPKFLKHNKPENPNVLKSWIGGYEDLPECDLKEEIFQHLIKYVGTLSEGFQKAFTEAFTEHFPKGSRKQEQEQEQDKEERECECAREDAAPPVEPPEDLTPEFVRNQEPDISFVEFWEAYPRKEAKHAAWEVWLQKRKAKRLPGLHNTILPALTAQIESGKWTEERFIPEPKNWLKDERWNDKVTPKARTLPKRTANNVQAAKEFVEKRRQSDA